MISSNKSSTFTAKYKSDNEETPLEKPHQDTSTLKQDTLERIKRLHIKCGFLDTEHLFMLPKTWLEYQQYEDVYGEITKSFYNAYCTPKAFFVEKYYESWDPKIHGPRNYLHIFMRILSLSNAVPRSIIHLQCLEMLSKKIRDHIKKGTMNDGTPLSFYDSEIASRVKKNRRAMLKKLNMHCYYLGIDDDALFRNR